MLAHNTSSCTTESPGVYMTIGEAADLLGVSVATIRLYEREGLIVPYRRKSRHRRFSLADIERIRCLRAMITDQKVSIAGIRMLLAMIPCWKIMNCSDEVRSTCPAFSHTDAACWASGRIPQCRTKDCRHCSAYNTSGDCHSLKSTLAQFVEQSGTGGTSAGAHTHPG
jgi:MerR family transcriptional regulator, heat shock protein HspR